MNRRLFSLLVAFPLAALMVRAEINIDALVAQAVADAEKAPALVAKTALENPDVAVKLVAATATAIPGKAAEIVAGVTDCVPADVREALAAPPAALAAPAAAAPIPLPQPINPDIVSPS